MIRTPHFKFPYFQDGELYSATSDEERAVALDLLLKGLSDIVTDGIIEGWEISDEGGLDIEVTPGKGIISGQYGVTKNSVVKSLSDDATNYVYAIRNSNIVDGVSTSSDKVNVSFVDITAPAAPSTLQVSSTGERFVVLSWKKNTDSDISYYKLYRKLPSDISYTFVSNVDHLTTDSLSTVSYTDSSLDPETQYNYGVSAVDLSGNEGSMSFVNAETDTDTTPASDVTNIRTAVANKSVSFTWNPSTSDDIDSYIVVLSELTAAGEVDSTVTVNVGTNLYYFNNGLKNNVSYRAYIKTLDTFGNVSDGIEKTFTPRPVQAPEEVGSFGYSVVNARSPNPITPELTFSWAASVSSDVSHYNLYIYEDGVPSDAILIGNNLTRTMISYPFRENGDLANKMFQDGSDYEVRLTAVDSEGYESDGIFIKVSIPDYSPPEDVRNTIVSSGDEYVAIEWDASDEKDFSNYELYYWDVSTENTFSESVSYSSYSGDTFTTAPISGSYPAGSWVELTASPESGGESVKLLLASPVSPGDTSVVCDYIPTYYSASGSIKITNPPAAVTFGQREHYRIEGLTNGVTYKIIIVTVDENNNKSDGVVLTGNPEEAVLVIENPLIVTPKGKDSEILLSWSRVDNAEGYKVYRAGPLDLYDFEADASDFSLIATIEGQNVLSMYDIGLTNGSRYSYIVTSYLGSFESTLDVNDQVIETPVDTTNPEPPENITASVASGQVTLSWDPPTDITGIEGWNVYRNNQKYGVFELIASIPFTTLSYVDEGLVDGEEYFYIVRSFSNTVDINTSISSTPPSTSILIGTVVTQTGDIISITPERTIIADLENTVQSLTTEFLKDHKHSATVEEEFSDTRNQALQINLSKEDDVTVFTTNDYQNYFSERDLTNESSYVVYINDEIPSLLYEVDFNENKIVFEQPLYSEGASSLYSEPPIVRLQFVNLKEISGKLNSRFIDDLSAAKIVSGVLPKALLPTISHRGRIKEDASVRTYVLLSDDNIYYDLNNITYIVDGENVNITMGTPTVFYDFFEYGGILYGASSDGILKSEDNGITWEGNVEFTDLTRKFVKKEVGDNISYFALCRRKVYSTKNASSWFSMNGLDAVNIIHDMAEDSSGNVYLATDTGVYVYNLEFESKYRFDAASIIEFESTTSEALSVINIGSDDMLVTTSEGVFVTSDLGVTWSQYSSVSELYNLRDFDSKIIAVNEEGYLNYSEDKGINWTTIQSLSGITRDDIFEVIDGRLFFTTSEGIFYTDDLETVREINGEFKKRLNKNHARGIYGTSKTDALISFDNKLYRWKDGETTLWSEFVGTIPSVYLNGSLMSNGYYYNTDKNDLYFEWKKSYDDVNTIAVEYDEYLLPGGGWQDIDTDDVEVSVFVNGENLGSISSSELGDDYIDTDEDSGSITNKRYEFAYKEQRKITVHSKDGKIYVTGPQLTKFDEIQVSIANVTLTEEGSYTHDEVDDALSKRDVGLPFHLGNAYLDNMLQMGLHAEHNFIESVQTDTQYPYASTRVIRSFNSELINSDHFIFGRKFYDSFNSTIDYVSIASNKRIDENPFIVKGFYEIGGETWIATDRNIFVLSSDRRSVDREIAISSSEDLDITSITEVGDNIYVVASDEVYVSSNGGVSWTKNEGYGLPRDVYQIANVFNILIVGGSDGVYYAEQDSDTWTKADFYDSDAESVTINKQVSSLIVPGSAYCLIDNIIYRSINGVTWRQVFSFDNLSVTGLVADRLFPYNNNVFALTNKGLYNDIGSLNNTVSDVSFEIIEIDTSDSTISTKSFSSSGSTILVLSEKNTLYRTSDSGTTWTKQTISAVEFADMCHMWNRLKVTDSLISDMNTLGIPLAITNKLAAIKNIVYSTETSFRNALQSIYTTVEYNNYGDSIVENSYSTYSDTELISSLDDVYVRQEDLTFDYGFTVARADRAYNDSLKQPISVASSFDKVSIYLSPKNYTSTDYSVTLSVYGADSSNNIVSGIISSDTKSASEIYGPGWYNFRIYYPGGYGRVMLVLTQNYGDNNNCVKWDYSVSSLALGAINNSGVQSYTYNYVLWKYDDAVDDTNQRVISDPADESNVTPDIGSGEFYQTKYEDDKVKLALDPKVLSFLVDQSGSQTWNDYYGSRFDLIRQFASDLNNIYPGQLYYALATYGAKIIDTLEIELVEETEDNIFGGTYRVVRRTDTYPTTPLDGSIIASTGLTVAADETVVNGTTYYYSIFNMRDDTIYSEPEYAALTVHNRDNPLPVAGLELEEVVVKETIGSPAAEVDTGKRKVIITFRTIENYTNYYNAVRIVRKECYQDEDVLSATSLSSAPSNALKKHEIEDDDISNPHDGTVVYEGSITSGENIIVDDFSGSYEPINGIKYYYAIYTKNSTGNYCLPSNALQESIRISSVWREWMYDPTYVVSQIPAELTVSPSDAENFKIEAGNGQNKISWTLPSSDTAIGVLLFASKDDTPDVDPLKIAHLDAEGKTGSISSDSDDFDAGSTYGSSTLLYQGDGTYFVHRELENNRKYYYRLYTYDRVRTLSAGNPKGEAVPSVDIVDDFEPPAAKDFYTEIFNDEKIILRWGREEYYKGIVNYFDDEVTVRTYAYDESGSPINEIEDFDFEIVKAVFVTNPPLEIAGGGESSEVTLRDTDYSMAVDKTSFDGEIRAGFTLTNAINPSLIDDYVAAQFTVKSIYKVYDAEKLEEQNELDNPSLSASEVGVDPTLYEEGQDLVMPGGSDDALEFSLESGELYFSMINPLNLSSINKYPKTQKVAQKETVTDSTGASEEIVVYYDGVYAKSGMSYYGEVEVAYEGESLDDDDTVEITAEVYELDYIQKLRGGGERRVWKQNPSEIFELENEEIEITSTREVDAAESGSTDMGGSHISSVSVGEFRLLAPDQAAKFLNILITARINGYTAQTEHIIKIKSLLNVDLEAEAPVADGRDVAEQFADVYVGPPKYDEISKLSRSPVPDGTLVKWQLEKGRYGQDRPFYSSESVPLKDGIYSVVRDGIARNVFFGPASDVEAHLVADEDEGLKIIGEEYTITASCVYNAMFGEDEADVEIKPIGETGTSYRFYMTNGYEMRGHEIYADGTTPSTIEILADPLATGGDGGQRFYDCLDINNMPYIPLLEGQKIEMKDPNFGGNITAENSDIYYTYGGTKYIDPTEIPIAILNGKAEFSVSINAFVGPPPKEKQSPPEEPQFPKCLLYGNVPPDLPYPPKVSFSGQTQSFFAGRSITMWGGGNRTNGMPPVVMILKEPLEVKFQKMMSKGNIVVNPPNDGLNETLIYFEITFSGDPIPDGSPIAFDFVFSNGDEEITREEIDGLDEEDRKKYYAGFSTYEEFVSEINLESHSAITSTVDGKSVAYCTLNPTRIKNDATVTIRATSTYDKLGTVEREISDDVKLKFLGTEEKEGGKSVYLKVVERYNTISDTWEEIDEMNLGRVGPVTVYDSSTEKIFAIGGLTESGISVTGEEFEYARADKSGVDGSYGTWSYISEMVYGRGFAQSAIYNGKIYVFGGFGYDPFSGQSGPNSNSICEVYDIASDTWTVLDNMPHPVSHGTAEIIGDNIYVFSGLASMIETDNGHTIDTFNNYLMKYNITTDTWSTIDTLDATSNALMRVSPVSYVKGGKIYVFGGILNEFDPESPEDALFVNTLVEIDVSNENNITYTVKSYTNSPIQRYRAGSYGLLGNNFYVAGGSGIKQYVDGAVTRQYQSNTLRALESLDTTTNTWTTYRNLSKMTYERHSLGSTDDSEYFYAIGGGGSGYEPGKLLIDIKLNPSNMRADGKSQVSAFIYLEDTTGEPPEDGIKILMRGYVLVALEEGKTEDVSATNSDDSSSTGDAQSGSVSEMANRVSIYPVLYSDLTLYSKSGAAGTILLERAEDILVALKDLVQYIDGDDTVIGIVYDEENKTIKVPKKEPLELKLNEERDLYQIVVEATIEDDFYFGRTDTEKTLASNMSGYLQQGETGLLPGQMRDPETGEIVDDPDYVDPTETKGNSLTSPEEAEQDQSPTVPVYNDMAWIPFIDDEYDILTYSQFTDEIDLLDQAIPFGGSPHWDGIIDFSQNTLKKDSIFGIEKFMVDVSDNEENLSENLLEDAIDQVHLVDGYRELPVFTNMFVTSFPPSLSARKGQTDVIDLEKLAGETRGLSHTILDDSYIRPIVKKIKIGSVGAMGRGTYTQVVDFGQTVHLISLRGLFELYQYTNGWIEIYSSTDGYNYDSVGILFEPDAVNSVNVSARYVKFVVTLSSEFGNASLSVPVPSPAFLDIEFVYSEPKTQYIYTYSYDVASYIREIYMTMNGTVPSTSEVNLGLTASNSTNWDDYQKDAQPSVSSHGRTVIVNSTMSLLNLVGPSTGGNTPLTFKTYEEILDEFTQEKQTEYGKVIDSIIILEYRTDSSDGRSRIIFADASALTIDEAPDFSDAIDFSTIEGADPTKDSTSGTILNYDFIYSIDGYLFTSRYGRWQPESSVNVYRNGILVDPTEYVLLRSYGSVKFFKRQRLTNNYAIEVAMSPKYRIGIAVTNRDNVNYAVLDEFAYIYNTNFVKSTDYNNSIPTVSDLYVTPVKSLKTSTFTVNYTYTDGNNDVERNSEIQWYINGGVIPELKNKSSWSQSDLVKHVLKDGDRIFFTVKPSDGKVFGALTTSRTTYIGDTPPSITGLRFLYIHDGVVSQTPDSDTEIHILYTYFDTQGRPESGTIIEWFVNGESLVYDVEDPTVLKNDTTDQNDELVMTVGNVIKAKVTPSNGIIKGSVYETEEIVVTNSAPKISRVSLSPSDPDEDSVLTVSYEFTDRDDDEDQTEIKWYKNGEIVSAVSNSTQVNASYLVTGDSWYAELTPYDGQDRGIVTRTSTVTVS